MTQQWINHIASDEVLQQAYKWLKQARQYSNHNDDCWHMRFHWNVIKPRIQRALLDGEYHFSPCKAVQTDGGSVGRWCAEDALVIKAISLVLTNKVSPKLSDDCYHLAGKGLKACVSEVQQVVSDYRYVCRSDVNSYYATIDHIILMTQLKGLIPDLEVLVLIEQLLARLDDVGGNLYTVTTGINKGSPLLPLLGAIYLLQMDKVLGEYCAKHNLRYYRYMDDWLILCKTRNQLRYAVRLMNQQLDLVKQTKHPFKTYIGRIKHDGFDFLGYRLAPKDKGRAKTPLGLAWKTWANHLTKLQQLYEQGGSKDRIAEYVTRWLTWVRGGVTIDPKQVIQEGLNSQLAQGIGDSRWLAELYGRVVEQWAERH